MKEPNSTKNKRTKTNMEKTLKEQLEFLAKDEQEAINGYDEVIASLGDNPIVAQLKKIRNEEVAHLNFLNEAKENPDLEYVDPNEAKEASKLFGMDLKGE